MNRFRYYLRQLGLMRDHEPDDGRPREVDNVDALAAATRDGRSDPQGEFPGSVPPGYIKPYDEGRPRQ